MVERKEARSLLSSSIMDSNLALCGLVTARLFLAFAPLPEQLKHDHLLSSPLTSNPRCTLQRIHCSNTFLIIRSVHEGIHLFQNGIDPYSGGVFYQVRCQNSSLPQSSQLILQSPLYLSIFSTLLPLNRITGPILWTVVDGIAAWALIQIWQARSRVQNGARNVLVATLCVKIPCLNYDQTDVYSQLSFQSILVPAFACFVDVLGIEHASRTGDHVRF